MKVLEDRSPSAVYPVRMPVGMQKYLAAVVLRLGRGFSVSALINQIVPKYLETYAALLGKPELEEQLERARKRFETMDTVVIDHRMPLSVADQIRARVPGAAEKDGFNQALDQLALLATYDFRQNGPLKGREF
jgi:hypothetical protein